jgi:hypothetical protein
MRTVRTVRPATIVATVAVVLWFVLYFAYFKGVYRLNAGGIFILNHSFFALVFYPNVEVLHPFSTRALKFCTFPLVAPLCHLDQINPTSNLVQTRFNPLQTPFKPTSNPVQTPF